MTLASRAHDRMSSYNRFGYEWTKYSRIIPLYEEQFKAWIQPLTPRDFKGLRVLDGGCGTGRNSLWPANYGALEVVAFDVDPRSVAVARKNLAGSANAKVCEHSLYDIPFTNEFDLAFSIGVIHHLADPRKAVSNLVKAVKPGGRVLLWVYGREGSSFVKTLVNAARKVCCRLPLAALNVLTRPLSFLWWSYIKIFPQRHPYHALLKSAPFWHIHSILFDQLLPEIANYWTRIEAVALFDDLPVDVEHVTWVNKGSWTVVARKHAQA